MRIAASALLLSLLACASAPSAREIVEIPADELEDRVRGGMLAQFLGNLNGLPHEFKYIAEPGRVERYVPALPEGAWTDDDTDLEWVYISEMARSGEAFLPPDRIAGLWKRSINQRIWCANLYARQLMDLEVRPPVTGLIAVNPWSVFNISGQFVCESFGLVAPGLPQTASRIGLHYTRVTIDGEPAQTTQLFCSMIAAAFVEKDLDRLLDAGLAAVDPASETAQVVRDVRAWHRAHPDDWKAARLETKRKYQRHNGEMRDRNGYELNTAGTIAALLYGKGDLVETLRIAFNFGWDCDNNAASAAVVVGVLKGRKWMDAQGWTLKDVYRNTCRDGMPKDETMTGFSDKVWTVAQSVLRSRGAEVADRGGRAVWRIPVEASAPVQPLPKPLDRREEVRARLLPEIEKGLRGGPVDLARAAYYALALGESARLARERPEDWAKAVAELKKFPNVVREIYNAPRPSGMAIQAAAKAAGIEKPPAPKK
jgi:hypothetical protein